MSKVRVLIVDDHEIVREGLRSVLQKHPTTVVVGDAASGDQACERAASLHPDIVIMDLSMPGLNGTDATRRLLEVSPDSRVVALTAHDEVPYVSALVNAGARAYVLKRAVVTNLFRAIDVVMDGGTFIDPELVNRLRTGEPDVDTLLTTTELSHRETEIASLTARGCSNVEIGRELAISVKTVETHKSRLMAKLGLKTRAQLVRYAIYRGWL